MSTPEFGREYADLYDLLYSDKDYEAECNLVEEVFRRYGTGRVHTILDLGCGTGNHAVVLAQRGYQVTGVDRSPEMLARAREKVSLDPLCRSTNPPTFYQGDVRQLELGQQFDAVLMMFAVLGYQLTNDDVSAALRTVRRHLKPEGLFVCDVWYGPAVIAMRPSERAKVISTDDGKVLRIASGSLDIYHHLTEVHYYSWRLRGQQVVSESEEVHHMRYFFPQELGLFMAQGQLELVDIYAFGSLIKAPGEDTWNVLIVAKNAQ
jgi:ubiquinone/menaquinone biosynthesis C-methylase UbiE